MQMTEQKESNDEMIQISKRDFEKFVKKYKDVKNKLFEKEEIINRMKKQKEKGYEEFKKISKQFEIPEINEEEEKRMIDEIYNNKYKKINDDLRKELLNK
jgi:hypothetical protein